MQKAKDANPRRVRPVTSAKRRVRLHESRRLILFIQWIVWACLGPHVANVSPVKCSKTRATLNPSQHGFHSRNAESKEWLQHPPPSKWMPKKVVPQRPFRRFCSQDCAFSRFGCLPNPRFRLCGSGHLDQIPLRSTGVDCGMGQRCFGASPSSSTPPSPSFLPTWTNPQRDTNKQTGISKRYAIAMASNPIGMAYNPRAIASNLIGISKRMSSLKTVGVRVAMAAATFCAPLYPQTAHIAYLLK